MDWATVTEAATTIGEVASAVALMSGFVLYKITRRDDYVAEFKRMIAAVRGRCHHLDDLITSELIGEVVRSVVFSKELERPLKQVLDLFFNATPRPAEDELVEFMEKKFPPITVAVHSPLVDSYESLLIQIDSDLAKYQTEFPALYRVFSAVRGLLGNVERALKRTAKSDELWGTLIPQMFKKETERHDLDGFRDRIAIALIGLSSQAMAEKGQRAIDNALTLLDIVADAYLALPEHRVLRWSKYEKSVRMIPLKDTKKTTDDLREAEKALKKLLSQDEALQFRQLLTLLEALEPQAA
jgi:hypothetical protein